jgi:hypothetical protein
MNDRTDPLRHARESYVEVPHDIFDARSPLRKRLILPGIVRNFISVFCNPSHGATEITVPTGTSTAPWRF